MSSYINFLYLLHIFGFPIPIESFTSNADWTIYSLILKLIFYDLQANDMKYFKSCNRFSVTFIFQNRNKKFIMQIFFLWIIFFIDVLKNGPYIAKSPKNKKRCCGFYPRGYFFGFFRQCTRQSYYILSGFRYPNLLFASADLELLSD